MGEAKRSKPQKKKVKPCHILASSTFFKQPRPFTAISYSSKVKRDFFFSKKSSRA
jgi:hypothetical protein